MKHNQGLTLVELLIGILLTSMIFLAASSLVVTLFTSNTRTKQLDEVQQVKNDIFNELSNAIKWSATVTVDSVNKLKVVTFADDSGVSHSYTYEYDSTTQTLTKQVDTNPAASLHSNKVEVTDFEIMDRSVNPAAGAPRSLDIFIGLRDAQQPTIVEAFRIVASQRSVE